MVARQEGSSHCWRLRPAARFKQIEGAEISQLKSAPVFAPFASLSVPVVHIFFAS